MKEVLGLLATASLWAVYAGLLLQYRKVWLNNVRPTFPALLSAISMAIYVTYVVWGFAISPIDKFRIAAFIPGAVLMPILQLQYGSARPPWRSVVLRAGLAAAGTFVLVAACYTLRGPLNAALLPIGIATTAVSISYSVIGIPRQIKEVRQFGTEGSSTAFAAIVLAGFVIWLAYGFVTNDWLLVVSQSIGAWLQSKVLWLHIRRT